MKKDLLFVISLFFYGSIIAQVTTESIDSKVLNAKQSVTVKLPKNYAEHSNLNYPIILVLDGDYLFNPIIGQTDFQNYFGILPESIIVGINYGTDKFSDVFSNKVSNLAFTSGDKFSEFVSEELLPYLDEKYNTNKFRVIVGHQKSTNLINSFLLNDQSPFQAYIGISPEFRADMSQKIVKKLQSLDKDVVFYMASTTNDLDSVVTNVISTGKALKNIDNNHLKYSFDYFDGLTHHTMVMSAIARGFEKVFDVYEPITYKGKSSKVLSYENTLDDE